MDPIQVAIVATAAQLVVKGLEKATELTVEKFCPTFLKAAKYARSGIVNYWWWI
ncbi:MAG: hypothetical protein AAGA67_01085 [Cyanobacteria bacterium P01_F01_bin.153]